MASRTMRLNVIRILKGEWGHNIKFGNKDKSATASTKATSFKNIDLLYAVGSIGSMRLNLQVVYEEFFGLFEISMIFGAAMKVENEHGYLGLAYGGAEILKRNKRSNSELIYEFAFRFCIKSASPQSQLLRLSFQLWDRKLLFDGVGIVETNSKFSTTKLDSVLIILSFGYGCLATCMNA
ncbi:hypothetical protein QVD17_06710 [Tagetes erecta]|uniref:Uncharacterized protein n=1 Tax=Tagetes erecta TaxID=13708 RepID=A0AAD8LMA7_TARER|nr:hypothetical protein QVD17_06710 [Tagetes erecta]